MTHSCSKEVLIMETTTTIGNNLGRGGGGRGRGVGAGVGCGGVWHRCSRTSTFRHCRIRSTRYIMSEERCNLAGEVAVNLVMSPNGDSKFVDVSSSR